MPLSSVAVSGERVAAMRLFIELAQVIRDGVFSKKARRDADVGTLLLVAAALLKVVPSIGR